MKFSVVIPVYNAEYFVEEAVKSALMQPETGEVLLVEDCSPDNSLSVCQALEKRYSNVRLIQHEAGRNRGAGISRNVGIQNAAYDYVAFLDADDFFLENRFSSASDMLSKDSSIDGVYEAIGSKFESEEAETLFFRNHEESNPIATIAIKLPPEQLFYYLVVGGVGYFHLNGFVARKKALIEVGMFPELRLHQDTVLCIKLAAKYKLCPGELVEPVAMRRLHASNRITNPNIHFNQTRCLMFENLKDWIRDQELEVYKKRLILKRYHRYRSLLDLDQGRYIAAVSRYAYRKLMFREDESRYLKSLTDIALEGRP